MILFNHEMFKVDKSIDTNSIIGYWLPDLGQEKITSDC